VARAFSTRWTNPGSRKLAALWLLVAALYGTTAAAGSDCSAVPACQNLVDRGVIAFKAAQYEQAIDFFRAGYEKVEDPRLLVFIGRAHFKMKQTRAALTLFEQALSDLKPGPDRTKLEQYIEQAKQVIAAEKAATTQRTASSAAGAPTPTTTGSATSTAAASSEGDGTSRLTTAPAAPAAKEGKVKPWVWALVGVGAAAIVGTAVGVGVYYGTRSPMPDATLRYP